MVLGIKFFKYNRFYIEQTKSVKIIFSFNIFVAC